MSSSTCRPGSVLQRLGTLISNMPSSILNSLNICGSLLQGAWCSARTKSKCVSLAHISEPLWGRVPNPLFVYATLKPEGNDQSSIIEIISVHRDIFLEKSPKDKAEEWLYWIRAKTHIAQAGRNEGISTTCCYFMNIQSLIHTISTFIRVE